MTQRRRARARLRLAGLGATGALVLGAAGVGLGAGPAGAVTVADWDRLAVCESGGRWNINTGNGYYGGLQFSASSWAYAGGTRYAARADLATKAQQIATANRLLAVQGWRAWPACTAKLGMRGISTTFVGSLPVASPAKAQARVKAAASRSAGRSTSVRTYTVRPGDTLSKIAARHHVRGGWQALWAVNKQTVRNPNAIYVGQVLRLR